MPTAPLRNCTTPGCPHKVTQGRCASCAGRNEQRRGTAAQRGYDAKWRQTSALFLKRHPTCVDCGQKATVPDHAPRTRKQLIDDGVNNPDAWRHLQARCAPCHAKKTIAFDGGFGRDATSSTI